MTINESPEKKNSLKCERVMVPVNLLFKDSNRWCFESGASGSMGKRFLSFISKNKSVSLKI